ncbi:MAG: hypothetical protein ACOC2R_03055 [Spirochaetota bacterium]
MEELHQLSEAIRQYEEGDLLAVAEIREIAETLQATTEDKQTAAGLAEIITTAEEIVLQGPSADRSAGGRGRSSEADGTAEASGASRATGRRARRGSH